MNIIQLITTIAKVETLLKQLEASPAFVDFKAAEPEITKLVQNVADEIKVINVPQLVSDVAALAALIKTGI